MVEVARQRRMQHADIETVVHRRRIRNCEIVSHGTRLETLPVNRNANWQVIVKDGFRLPITEDMGVVWQRQRTGDAIVSVMIAFDNSDANVVLLQPRKLIAKKDRHLHVGSVVVVKITREYHKCHALFDRRIDKFFEGIPTRAAHTFDLRWFRQNKRQQWAIEVDVGRMKKLESVHRHLIEPMLSNLQRLLFVYLMASTGRTQTTMSGLCVGNVPPFVESRSAGGPTF